MYAIGMRDTAFITSITRFTTFAPSLCPHDILTLSKTDFTPLPRRAINGDRRRPLFIRSSTNFRACSLQSCHSRLTKYGSIYQTATSEHHLCILRNFRLLMIGQSTANSWSAGIDYSRYGIRSCWNLKRLAWLNSLEVL